MELWGLDLKQLIMFCTYCIFSKYATAVIRFFRFVFLIHWYSGPCGLNIIIWTRHTICNRHWSMIQRMWFWVTFTDTVLGRHQVSSSRVSMWQSWTFFSIFLIFGHMWNKFHIFRSFIDRGNLWVLQHWGCYDKEAKQPILDCDTWNNT